jgi:hypothetical protein
VSNGRLLAGTLVAATVTLVAIGTVWPVATAASYAGANHFTHSASTPEGAMRKLADDIKAQAWDQAYSSLANKAQFTQPDFVHDLTGNYPNLRTYSALESYEVQPLHAGDSDAEFRLKIQWSTVIGTVADTRDVRVVKRGAYWAVEWPISREPVVPPQVIPVNYLRWDVIYRGAGDDWGAQDVDAPHVRIVDMHPVQRAEGLVLLGELLNEDVVPAQVSVTATLLSKKQSILDTEGCFDEISHLLLPKQVTPFIIKFPGVQLSDVASVRMTPFSTLIPASADPVIEIQNEHMNPAPDAALSGELVNQSGQTANVAHVLGTFYDKNGQVVWVADQYVDRALPPQTPVPFNIHIPEDLARKVSSERTVVATYSFGGFA